MKLYKLNLQHVVFFTFILGVILAGWRYLPIGLTNPERYFDPLADRKLQQDEIGQLENVSEEYMLLTFTGDLFPQWDREIRHMWKYGIAFTSYGLPSAMMINPEDKAVLGHTMSSMIQKMKSRMVWGDFTEWGHGSDPISFQNVMYKGHLNLMYGLYQLTTGDHRYAREFTWLTNQIVAEMRLHHNGHFDGSACEPDAWFVECNAIGILSLYVYDRLYGTDYTENESSWTLDFIEKRMTDPETGLFYRVYHPEHDIVDKTLIAYNTAWTLTFLRAVRPEWADRLYPVWKDTFVHEYGPYAFVDGKKDGSPSDPNAHMFGMWLSKEMGDVDLYGKLRNVTDQLIGLKKAEMPKVGLAYDSDLMMTGSILATKLHMGWLEIFDYDWGDAGKGEVPDVSDMVWTDLLAVEVYGLDPEKQLYNRVEGRNCPNCLTGDSKVKDLPQCSLDAGESAITGQGKVKHSCALSVGSEE